MAPARPTRSAATIGGPRLRRLPSSVPGGERAVLHQLRKETNPLKRFRNLLRQSEFHVLLFAFGFILLNWPFLAIFRAKPPADLLIYLYVLWAMAILLLYLVSKIGRESASGDDSQPRKEHGA